MTKKQKEFIESAKPLPKIYDNMKFSGVYIIDSGKQYNGFWGKNGFKNLIILGRNEEDEELYILSDKHCDIMEIENIYKGVFMYDIPKESDCIRMCFSGPYYFTVETKLSTLKLKVIKREDNYEQVVS